MDASTLIIYCYKPAAGKADYNKKKMWGRCGGCVCQCVCDRMYYGSNTQRDWSLTPVDLLVWGFSQHPVKLKQELASPKDRVIILFWARQYGYVVVCVVSVAKLAFACLFYICKAVLSMHK